MYLFNTYFTKYLLNLIGRKIYTILISFHVEQITVLLFIFFNLETCFKFLN